MLDMMKRISYLLHAILLVSFSLTFVSCEVDEKEEEELQPVVDKHKYVDLGHYLATRVPTDTIGLERFIRRFRTMPTIFISALMAPA